MFTSNVSKGWLGPAAGAGLGWAALAQAVCLDNSSLLHESYCRPRLRWQQLPRGISSHSQSRDTKDCASTFQVLACIFSTNMPLSKVSHVAELGDRDQEAQSAHNWPKARA